MLKTVFFDGDKLVAEGIGIHFHHFMTQKANVFIGKMVDANFLKLRIEIFVESSDVVVGVFVAKPIGLVDAVVADIIDWIDFVSCVYSAVDDATDLNNKVVFVIDVSEMFKLIVDGACHLYVNATFVAEEARLHAQQIVVLTFVEVRVFFLEEEFLSLEVVVGVELVGEGDGADVELSNRLVGVSSAGEGEHFDDAFLCKVVGVFGSTFALRYPDRAVFVGDDKAYIFRKLLRGFESFDKAKVALDDETFVELYERFNPRINEEVVAEGDLARAISVVDEADVEEGGVEHNVAMVGNISVFLLFAAIFVA